MRDYPLLYAVTGGNMFCGPCTLSALTGLSSDRWPGELLPAGKMATELERLAWDHAAPFYASDESERLAGLTLAEFREPGRWAVALAWDDADEGHAVAVAIHGGRRQFADQDYRVPARLVDVLAREADYRTATIATACRVVPAEPLWVRDGTG